MLCVRFDPETHRKFKMKVAENDTSMQEALVELVEKYIRDNQ